MLKTVLLDLDSNAMSTFHRALKYFWYLKSLILGNSLRGLMPKEGNKRGYLLGLKV